MGRPPDADREGAVSSPIDELRDEINQFSEYRWMAATLACCAVGLVSATVLITTGDRFEFRPPPRPPLEDKFVETPDASDSAVTAKRATGGTSTSKRSAAEPSSQTRGQAPPKRRRIVMRLKSPWCSGGLASQSFYRCRTNSW